MTHDEVLNLLRQRCGADSIVTSEFRDNRRVTVSAEKVFRVLECLKGAGFDLLSDLSAGDYLRYPGAKDRYGVWYVLVNTTTGLQLIVKTWVNDPDPTLPSVYSLWKGSDWMEREVFDMFGIQFDGHPDLRRILLPEEFSAFPLRKDYPLQGRGERHNFRALRRGES